MKTTRRGFLRDAAALVAAPMIARGSALGAGGATAPSNRINLAVIGAGNMGKRHMPRLLFDRGVQVLAVCDPDAARLQETREIVESNYAQLLAKGSYGGCAAVADFREVLRRDDIDAVMIITPDHWHVPIAIAAAKAGKDIYCEKPVSMTVRQGRRLVEAVRAGDRVFQTGSQYRSKTIIRKALTFVRGGGLGKVKAAFAHWPKIGVPTVGKSYVPLNPTLPGEPRPEGLDWERWVGPAPMRPYNSLYHRNPTPHSVFWAWCADFGLGAVTYEHAHFADNIQWALGMEESGPVEILHPSTGQFPTLTCRYANGALLHQVEDMQDVKRIYHAVPDSARMDGYLGGVFVGERGWISVQFSRRMEGGPESIFDEMKLRNRDTTASADRHHENWFDCIRSREKPSAHEEIGHRAASLGQIITASYRLGRSLRWDPAAEIFPGDDEANRTLECPVARDGWAT